MNILVIDGQGGRMGRQIVEALRERLPDAEIMAAGTNSAAAAAMLKGGATAAATGENAVIVACRRADAIIGPVGIVIADSLYGEVSPAMAVAVAQSAAVRVLIPVNHCDNLVAGTGGMNMQQLIADGVDRLCARLSEKNACI